MYTINYDLLFLKSDIVTQIYTQVSEKRTNQKSVSEIRHQNCRGKGGQEVANVHEQTAEDDDGSRPNPTAQEVGRRYWKEGKSYIIQPL